MNSTILLYEPRTDRVAHLVFLFNLADIRCTQARSAEEALNWLTAMRLQIIEFDLIMIGSTLGIDAENHFLENLRHTSLPVVYLQSCEEPIPAALTDSALICRPDDMLRCLTACLDRDSGVTPCCDAQESRRIAGY